MCSDRGVAAPCIVSILLIKVANFSAIAVWVVGVLFVLEFLAVCIYVYRAGTVGDDEGSVVTEQTRGSASPFRSGGFIAGRNWSKRKILFSRSKCVSEMSLVDGTATKAERLFVHGVKLAFLLFWLAFVFGILTILPSQPGRAVPMLLIMLYCLYCGVRLFWKERAEALRKLAQKQARRQT
jgi:hypothetical protein